ncbi:hypothetical protein Ae717Ps2_6661c [Pseudonocardia sp. Ae717_Ps2]|uniref:hypothetical protein n=1 Tax=Pseudonocardia sp. Ae717_Ps2 TaxID=1885573 RepID=UPI00094B2BE6|nr:hypothetical protein [Pseudonocardia sp. Ae717_Ps2]OLM28174.1 hypothetical protein Ae717Ps2_6661c [Pseudonocardia sp. Ae717_Ps2]
MLGLRGWVRALEITHSVDNGWHVHLHILMVVEQGMSDDAIEALTGGWFARWSAGLVKAGMPAPTEERGVDVQRADAAAMPETSGAWARYVCKGLASEAVMGSTKAARGTSRSIYELMRDATVGRRFENPDTGDVVQLADMQARALLAEYETAIRGRKAAHLVRWGPTTCAPESTWRPEQSDEDIVAEDLEGEPVAVIPPHSWKIVEPRAAELLHITEPRRRRRRTSLARRPRRRVVATHRPHRHSPPRRRTRRRRLTLPGVVFLRKTPNLLRRRRHRHPRRR